MQYNPIPPNSIPSTWYHEFWFRSWAQTLKLPLLCRVQRCPYLGLASTTVLIGRSRVFSQSIGWLGFSLSQVIGRYFFWFSTVSTPKSAIDYTSIYLLDRTTRPDMWCPRRFSVIPSRFMRTPSDQPIVRDPLGFCDVRHRVLHTSSSSNRGCYCVASLGRSTTTHVRVSSSYSSTLSSHVCNLLCIVCLQWSSSCWLGLHHQHHAVPCVKTACLWARLSTQTTRLLVGASAPSTTSTASTSTSVRQLKRAIVCMSYSSVSTPIAAFKLRRHYDCEGMLAFYFFSIPSAMLLLRLRGMLQYI